MSEPQPVAVLVEDEQQIRRFVRAALESESWLVFEAETLKKGLTEAGTRSPISSLSISVFPTAAESI